MVLRLLIGFGYCWRSLSIGWLHRPTLNSSKGAIERYTDVEVLGYLPKNATAELPSRHLGLIPDVEMDDLDRRFEDLGSAAAKHIKSRQAAENAELPDKQMTNPFISTMISP